MFAHVPADIFDDNQWGHVQNLDCKFDGRSHVFAG